MKVGATRVGRVDMGSHGHDKGKIATSFAQLEKVLKRINKHDERGQLERVERTSVSTQQKLLKDQLLKAQEELALTEASKFKLCETIGRLQHEKEEQEKEVKRLVAELAASRESHEVLAKKVENAERSSEDAQRGYVRSLSARVKIASELLSKLRLTGALGICGGFNDQVERGLEFRDNYLSHKRKRVEEPPHSEEAKEASSVERACPIVASTSSTLDSSNPDAAGDDDMEDSVREEAHEQNTAPQLDVEKKSQDCNQCAMMSESINLVKAEKEKEVGEKLELLKDLRAKCDQLSFTLDQLNADLVAAKQLVDDKEEIIQDLKDALQLERSRAPAEDDQVKESEQSDTAERIKILEDNLAQLNTYADHLEMIISQCPSCSVKLQSEGTQDGGK